jgi:two-component system chemotaxis response regulator CheY
MPSRWSPQGTYGGRLNLQTIKFREKLPCSVSIISTAVGVHLAQTLRLHRRQVAVATAYQSILQKKENAMSGYKSDLLFGALTGNGRVLVVDDEPSVRTVVRMTLEKAGYDVLEAENGEKAIEAINTGENRLVLDTVICDIRMPKINGVQAIGYFQREYPHVPLIVLTAYPETDMAVSFMRNGVADYLVKPVEAEKLKAAVAKAMERRQVAWA